MTEKHSITDARRNLPTLIRDAENGKTVELTRRGEPVVVLIGHRHFERLAANRRGFGAAYQDFTGTVNLAELALDPANCSRACGTGHRVAASECEGFNSCSTRAWLSSRSGCARPFPNCNAALSSLPFSPNLASAEVFSGRFTNTGCLHRIVWHQQPGALTLFSMRTVRRLLYLYSRSLQTYRYGLGKFDYPPQ